MADESTGGVSFTGEPSPADGGHAEQSGGAAPDFFSLIPEEYKGSSWATKYGNDPAAFFKGVDNMSRLVGDPEARIVRPGEGATADDWKSFYSKIGVPESPDDYVLTVDSRFKELFLEGDTAAVTKMFHSANITPEQAQALLPAYLEYRQGQVDSHHAAMSEARASAEKALKDEWGSKYEENLANAARGLEKVGLFEQLEKDGLGNNAAILKIGEVLNRALGEDYQRTGESFKSQTHMAAMERELDRLTANPNFNRDEEMKRQAIELSKKINAMKNSRGRGTEIPDFTAG